MTFRMLAGALVIIALLGSGGFFGGRALLGGDDSGPKQGRVGVDALEGIDINELAAQGIFVTSSPEGYMPAVDSKAADKAADEFYPNVAARQVLLAHVKTDSFGGLDTDTWIVNIDPQDPNLTPEGAGGTTKYAVVFVDANDGHVLFSGNVEDPPPGGWGPDMGPGPSLVTPVDESSTPAQLRTPVAAE